ncbi:hypothetical protein [Microbispora sp. H10836]|uniref:hypothetical protein n=1 Tax=Microbispora sp. H10836 TaxID=2729106 RepID=UPI001472C8FE|nr:hypothetical protein [Microbispora sp. H10836]
MAGVVGPHAAGKAGSLDAADGSDSPIDGGVHAPAIPVEVVVGDAARAHRPKVRRFAPEM